MAPHSNLHESQEEAFFRRISRTLKESANIRQGLEELLVDVRHANARRQEPDHALSQRV